MYYKVLNLKNESFRRDLQACKGVLFTHSLGKNKKSETVLTTQEFCSRLNKLNLKGVL